MLSYQRQNWHQPRSFQTLKLTMIKPDIRESTIAEKFDAILQRFELKRAEWYTIFINFFKNIRNFEEQNYNPAVFETLQRRGTPYDRNSF